MEKSNSAQTGFISEEKRKELISSFRLRSDYYESISGLFLLGIIIFIGIGIYLFINAESISTAPIRNIQDKLNELNYNYLNLSYKIDQSDSLLVKYENNFLYGNFGERVFSSPFSRAVQNIVDSLNLTCEDSLTRFLGNYILYPVQEEIIKSREEYKLKISTIDQLYIGNSKILESAFISIQSDISDLKNNNSTPYLISTISTRLGSILLLIFLVQIFVSVYRYLKRMEFFYSSRSDALRLLESGDVKDLERIVSMISSDNISFGKLPSSPTNDLINFGKNINSLK